MKTKQLLKSKEIILLLFLFLIIVKLGFAQNYSKTWYMDRKSIDFSTAIPTISSLPLATAPMNHVANGAYGITNNLLFYVNDEFVHDRNGNVIATFLPAFSTSVKIGPEMIITQVPGSCDNYYIIYTRQELYTGSSGIEIAISLSYARIDMSMNSGDGGVIFQDVQIGALLAARSYATLALSKLNSGTRNLFVARGYDTDPGLDLFRYSVTSTGITLANSWAFTTSDVYPSLEMDISPDQTMLALPNLRSPATVGTTAPDVTLFHLLPNGDLNPGLGVGGKTSISIDGSKSYTGVEFSPNSLRLFVGVKNIAGANIGIRWIDNLTSTPSVQPFISGATTYANSQLETAYDAANNYKIYAASTNSNLGYIDPLLLTPTFTANFITSTQPFVGPVAGANNPYVDIINPGFLVLPDQQDDENYDDRFPVTIPILCCLTSSDFTVSSYTANTTNGFSISNTQTWTATSNPFLYAYNLAHPSTPLASLSTVRISNQLIIPANFNISIVGMRFEYKPRTTELVGSTTVIHYGARAIVQNTLTTKGQLTLNSTTFTSYDGCGDGMWEGIEVWGNTLQNQSGLGVAQGRLNVNSGSFISNAYCGVYAGKKNTLYSIANPVTNTSGSIIVTNGATFKNNYVDVKFNPYNTANSVSSFRYSLFITDATLHPGIVTIPFTHIQLMDTKNIQFRTCTFKNAVPLIYPVTTSSGYGIYSYNTQFYCNPAITSTSGIGTGCTFENLRYGIYATATTTKTVTADQNIFRNCYRGGYIGNVSVPTFTRNNLFIYEFPDGTPEIQAAYGLYFDYSTGFKVTENNFYYNSHIVGTPDDVVGPFNVYGCIVNQSHPIRTICHATLPTIGYGGDEIYKNNFQEIFVATQAQGANSESNVSTTNPPGSGTNPCYGLSPVPNNIGLVYRCNNYLGVDKYNLRVTDYSLASVTGNIAYQQGTTVYPASNRFSQDLGYPTNTAPQNEIYFDASYSTTNPNDIEYVSQGNPSTAVVDRTQPNFYTPYTGYLNPTGVVNVPLTFVSLDATSCPSKINTGLPKISLGLISDAKTVIEAKILLLENGDADALLDLIATGSNGAILSGLMNQSPYLSDRIIIAALNKGLPPGHIKQIVIANSPVTAYVKTALNAVSLPNGIRNQINAAQTGISLRKNAEDIITDNYAARGYYYNEIIRYYLNDTLNEDGLDSIIKVVRDFDAPDNLCTITKAYLAKGDLVKAQETVNDVSLGGICNYLQTLIKIAQQYDNIYSVGRDMTIKSEVEAIASDKGDATSAGADAILKWVLENPFQEWLEPFHAFHSMTPLVDESTTSSIADVSEISVYPNPAHSIVNINYILPDDATQAVVNTYDYTGKLINSQSVYGNKGLTTVNVENLANGLYMYSILVNDTVVASQRIVVNK